MTPQAHDNLTFEELAVYDQVMAQAAGRRG